jgi:hypothetical protein
MNWQTHVPNIFGIDLNVTFIRFLHFILCLLYLIWLYFNPHRHRSHHHKNLAWERFELTALMLTGIECICSYKSTTTTIMTTTAPGWIKINKCVQCSERDYHFAWRQVICLQMTYCMQFNQFQWQYIIIRQRYFWRNVDRIVPGNIENMPFETLIWPWIRDT